MPDSGCIRLKIQGIEAKVTCARVSRHAANNPPRGPAINDIFGKPDERFSDIRQCAYDAAIPGCYFDAGSCCHSNEIPVCSTTCENRRPRVRPGVATARCAIFRSLAHFANASKRMAWSICGELQVVALFESGVIHQ